MGEGDTAATMMKSRSLESSPTTKSMAGNQRILPLDPDAISQIHSSKHITTLEGVVLSLLENSLDAAATKVEISVNWQRGACTVQDNGTGIAAVEFTETGGLGKMYCTSKRAPPDQSQNALPIHGSNGTFLAELAAMAFLKIASRLRDSDSATSISLHHGKVVTRTLAESYPPSHGTLVSVQDLFGNMPVRVKQRAIAADNTHDSDRRWQDLKHGIVAVMLAWPHPCSVRIQDELVNTRTIQLSGQHPAVAGLLTEKGLERLAGRSVKNDLSDALPILFQMGLAPVESKQKWVPVQAKTQLVTLKGLICLDAAATKACQFISLGHRPLCESAHLRSVINDTFLRSSFGAPDDDAADTMNDRQGQRPYNNDANRSHEIASVRSKPMPTRAVDRNPMYFLQIYLRRTQGSAGSGWSHVSDAMLETMRHVLEAVIMAWLESNHFRPRISRKRRGTLGEHAEYIGSGAQPLLSTDQDARSASPLQPVARNPDFTDSANRKSTSRQTDARFDPGDDLSREKNRTPRAPTQSTAGLSRIRAGQRVGGILSPKNKDEKSGLDTSVSVISLTQGSERNENAQADDASTAMRNPVEADSRSRLTGEDVCYVGEAAPSDDFGSIDERDLIAAAERYEATAMLNDSGHVCEDSVLHWTDPATKQTIKINTRTGVVLPAKQYTCQTAASGRSTQMSRERAGPDLNLTSAGKPITLARRNKCSGVETGPNGKAQGLLGFLGAWNNPIFVDQAEEPIPVASTTGPGTIEVDADHTCFSRDVRRSCFTGDDFALRQGLKLSKHALQHAIVIGQVDCKFILCKMPHDLSEPDSMSNNGIAREVLILVDQHAASERIILEELLADLCVDATERETIDGISNMKIIKRASLVDESACARPLRFEVPDQECSLFAQYSDHFKVLGIEYSIESMSRSPSPGAETAQHQCHRLGVTHLPSAIAERCTNLPSLCIEMMRAELWRLADGSKRPLRTLPASRDYATATEGVYWTSLLPVLPDQLISMLHSRACRSAIMFNDALEMTQCVELVGKLSRCIFPFICAHGRVSMVPLGDIGELESVTESDDIALLDLSMQEYESGSVENEQRGQRSETKQLLDWVARAREAS